MPRSSKPHFHRMYRLRRQAVHCVRHPHRQRALQHLVLLQSLPTPPRRPHTSTGFGIRISSIRSREAFTTVSCRTHHSCPDFLRTKAANCVRRMNRRSHWKRLTYHRPVIVQMQTVIAIRWMSAMKNSRQICRRYHHLVPRTDIHELLIRLQHRRPRRIQQRNEIPIQSRNCWRSQRSVCAPNRLHSIRRYWFIMSIRKM